jgi:hypothetical protein
MTSPRDTEHEIDDFSKPIRVCQDKIKALNEKLRMREEDYQAASKRQRVKYEASITEIRDRFAAPHKKFRDNRKSFVETIQNNEMRHQKQLQIFEADKLALDEKLQALEARYQELSTAQKTKTTGEIAPIKQKIDVLQKEHEQVPRAFQEALEEHKSKYKEYVVGLTQEQRRLIEALEVNKENFELCNGRHQTAKESYHEAEETYAEQEKKLKHYREQLKQAYKKDVQIAEGEADNAVKKTRQVKQEYLQKFREQTALVEKVKAQYEQKKSAIDKEGEGAFSEKVRLKEERVRLQQEQQEMARQRKAAPEQSKGIEAELKRKHFEQHENLEKRINKLHGQLRAFEGKEILELRQLKSKHGQEQAVLLKEKEALEEEIRVDNKDFSDFQDKNFDELDALDAAFEKKKKAVDKQCMQEERREGEEQDALKDKAELDTQALKEQVASFHAQINALETQRRADNNMREERLAPVEGQTFEQAIHVMQHLGEIMRDDGRFAEIEPLIDEVYGGLVGWPVALSPQEKSQRLKEEWHKHMDRKVYEQTHMLRTDAKKMKKQMDKLEEKIQAPVVLNLDERRARLKALLPQINDAILPMTLKKLRVALEQKQTFSEQEVNKLVKQLKSMVTSDEHVALVRSELFNDATQGSNERKEHKHERIADLFFRLDREIHDVKITALIEQLRAMTEQTEGFSIEGAFALVQALKTITDGDIDFMSALPNTFDRCAEHVIRDESDNALSHTDLVKATKIRLDSLLIKLEGDVEESKQRSSRFNGFTQAEPPKENEASDAVSYVLQCLKHVVTLMMYPFRSKPKEVTFFEDSKPQKSAAEVLLELKQVDTKLSIFNNALLFSSKEENPRGFDKK